MVARERVWSPQEQGLRCPPRRLCLLCRGSSCPAVCRQGGCRQPPAPSLCPHPRGGRMLGWAKRLQCSCLRAGRILTPGMAARLQEGTAPAAPTELLGHGRRKAGGPSSGLPARPRPSRLLPRTARPAGIHSARLRARISPTPPLLHPCESPRTLLACSPLGSASLQTSCSLPQPCSQLGGAGRLFLWRAPALGIRHGTANGAGIPPPCLAPVPPGTQHPPQPPQGEPRTQHGSSRSGGTRVIMGQRALVLRDGASSTATSRSREPAALGENKVSDQSNQ